MEAPRDDRRARRGGRAPRSIRGRSIGSGTTPLSTARPAATVGPDVEPTEPAPTSTGSRSGGSWWRVGPGETASGRSPGPPSPKQHRAGDVTVDASVDWATISSLATAAGTLVLAIATFSSVRSANRSARVAELSLLAGLRPVLVPSRPEHPSEWVTFADGHSVEIGGGQASAETVDDVVYLTMALHNVGNGIGVLHGWTIDPGRPIGDGGHATPEEFRRLSATSTCRPGTSGSGRCIREPDDPAREAVRQAIGAGSPITIDLLYGDQEGGQRTISRFRLLRSDDGAVWQPTVSRHWNLDRPDPAEEVSSRPWDGRPGSGANESKKHQNVLCLRKFSRNHRLSPCRSDPPPRLTWHARYVGKRPDTLWLVRHGESTWNASGSSGLRGQAGADGPWARPG